MSDNLLETEFIGLHLRSPLLVASGPASHDVKQVPLAEEQGIGGIVLKTVCSDKYAHMRLWPRPRYKMIDWDKKMDGRSRFFTLYSYEQGYSGTLEDYWEFIRQCKRHSQVPIIGSIFADIPEDWRDLALRVEDSGADAVELDISSPHRPGELAFETTFVAAIRAVTASVRIPVMVKLAATPELVQQAKTAEELGAASVTLCNRIRGLDVDVESGRPILHGYYAGVGGPWAKYYIFKHISEAYQEIHIPISATGGAISGEDVVKYIMVGATTVQILSVIMVNGWGSIKRINDEIGEIMARKNITRLEEIRGIAVHNMTAHEDIVRWSGEKKDGPRNEWE
jgi:dihydroorotate dehydrogenase (fumarate)